VSPQRDVIVLARRAVSAAGPATRPARRRPTADAPGGRQRYRRRQTTPIDDDDRQQTPTDDSVQNNTGLLGGTVITVNYCTIDNQWINRK